MLFFRKRKARKRAVVLMYHHINTPISDEWQLSVSPENFVEHLHVLKELNVCSLPSVVSDVKSKTMREGSVAITFDDGYLDNFTHAVPLLNYYQFPASFFLTNSIGSNLHPFWWDQLETLLIGNKNIPHTISLKLEKDEFQFDMSRPWQHIINESELAPLRNWLRWEIPPSSAHALFVLLSEKMKGLAPNTQASVIKQLSSQISIGDSNDHPNLVMNTEQTVAMADVPHFEVGGHTETHCALANFDGSVQKIEIFNNKKFLESLIRTDVRGFAYPHGSYNQQTISILRENGYDYACTTHEAAVNHDTKVYEIPRYLVKNWSGKEFNKQIFHWLYE